MTRAIKMQAPGLEALAGAKTTTAKSSVLLLNNILSGDKNQVPELVKIQAELIIKAQARGSRGDGGAMRLYFLARHFNKSGSQTIRLLDFWHFLKPHGLKRSTYERWFNRAVAIGLFTRRSKKLIDLADITGIGKAAVLFDCEITSDKPELIELKKLINEGWVNRVWACYVKQYEGKPISQGKLEKYTGIAARMQRIYERKAGVQIRRNYIVMPGYSADKLAGVQEFKHAGAFMNNGLMLYRTSNTREIVPAIQANKGSQRKIKKSIYWALSKLVERDAPLRLFNHTVEQFKDTLGNIGKLSKQGKATPDYIYLATQSPGFWDEVLVY